jgi:hypothetical protein
MNRELSINIFFLVIVNVLIKPFFIFGIDRQVQNLVPATDYGKYTTLLSLTLVFMIVNDLGIQNYNTRKIAGQPNLLQKYFPYLLSLKLALALVYVLVLGIAALLLGYEHSYFQLLAMLALNQVLISFILFFRANIASLHLYRTDSILSVLDRLLMIGICLPLLALHIMTIHLFIIAQTLAYLITLLAALTILWKQGAPLQFRWKNHLALAIFKKSLPFALSIFLMFVYARLDTILLERLLPDGTQQVAIYAAAFRLLDAANMIGVLFTGILLPMFSKMLYQQQDTQPTLQYSYKLLLTGTLIVAIGVSFFSTPIMHLLYTHTQPHSGLLLGACPLAGSGYAVLPLVGAAHHASRRVPTIPHAGHFAHLVQGIHQFVRGDVVSRFDPQILARAFISNVDDANTLMLFTNHPFAHKIHCPAFIQLFRGQQFLENPFETRLFWIAMQTQFGLHVQAMCPLFAEFLSAILQQCKYKPKSPRRI